MGRFIELPWAHQPQGAANLRPAIESALSVLALGSNPQFLGCSLVTEAGGITRNPSRAGIAWEGDGSNNIASATPFRDGSLVASGSHYFTLITVFRKRLSGAQTGHICGYGSTSGSSGNTLHRLIGGSSADQLQFQLQSSDSGLPYNTASSSANINDQDWHVAVIPYQVTTTLSEDSLSYFIDGVSRGTVARSLGVANTTFNRASVGATVRGGSAVSPGNWDVALYLHLLARMPDSWCKAASTLGTVWDAVFEPRRIWVPVTAAGGGLPITATGIASAEAFGDAEIHASVASAGAASSETFGSPDIAASITAAGIASSEQAGAPDVQAAVEAAGVESAEAFGLPQLRTFTIVAAGIPSAEAFGQVDVNAVLQAAGVASAEAWGMPSVRAAVAPAGVGSAEAFGSAELLARIVAAGVAGAEAFGEPQIGDAPPGASAAQVWAYTLSNGKTAGQCLVELLGYVEELHRIHGLQILSPLRTTPTTRSAGDIEQSLAEAGDGVTVQRL